MFAQVNSLNVEFTVPGLSSFNLRNLIIAYVIDWLNVDNRLAKFGEKVRIL